MIFALKALLAGLIIAFSSWLAGQNPRMAGFIIALPMASLIAIAFVYFEHNSVEKTVLYAKSILVAVPVSYLFFLPFFLAKQFNMNFWIYISDYNYRKEHDKCILYRGSLVNEDSETNSLINSKKNAGPLPTSTV